MSRFFTLVILLGLTQLTLYGGHGHQGPGGEAMLLGFVLIAAYLAGLVGSLAELPQITGYLIFGVLIGPHLLGILPQTAVEDFRLVNGGALSLIAMTAGGELRLESVRRRARSITSILAFQMVVVFAVVVAAVYWGRPLIPFLRNAPPRAALAVGLVFGLVAVAKSPATTIAVITEERARGILTETVLGITVMKDVLVLMLIALLIPLAAVVADPSAPFSVDVLVEVLWSIVLSILGGLGVGWLLSQYLRTAGEYRVVVVFLSAFLLVLLAEPLGLEYVLLAMAAGFFVQNFSPRGPSLLRALEMNSVPLYTLFFAVAGADLRLDLLAGVWSIVLLVVVLRMGALALSTYLGARAVGDPATVRSHAWLGFLAQAGVTLGIANIVRDRFAGWGPDVATVIVAMIAVNQLIGPPAFRFALVRAGESRRARNRRAPRELQVNPSAP